MTQLSNAALDVISKYVGGKTADQVAFIVEDLAESIEVWTKAYGLSDWRIFTYSPENVPVLEYFDKPGTLSMKLALSGTSPQIELIQPLTGPSIYHDFADARGYGQHHLGYFVPSIADVKRDFAEAGLIPVQAGAGYGLDGDGGFAYYDLLDTPLNLVLELIEVPARRRPSESI